MRDGFGSLHPIVNMLFFAGVIGITMFITHPVILGISFVTGVAYGVYLKGIRKMVRYNLLYSLPIILITMGINPLFNHYGVTILGYFPNGNPFTLESTVYGLVMALMLVSVITWFNSFNEVMTSDKFMYLFGKIIPTMSLIISMTLNLIPRLARRGRDIREGQVMCGRDRKIAFRSFSILTTSALDDSIKMADSMRYRGYGEKNRTAYDNYQIGLRDVIVIMLLLCGAVVYGAGAINGGVHTLYNPRIVVMFNGWSYLGFAGFGIFATMPIAVNVVYDLRWRRIRQNAKDMEGKEEYRLWEN